MCVNQLIGAACIKLVIKLKDLEICVSNWETLKDLDRWCLVCARAMLQDGFYYYLMLYPPDFSTVLLYLKFI